MTEITLALPYALPPAEMARDLSRALDTPALAMLLSRHNHRDHAPDTGNGRALPHETWLAGALGLAPAGGQGGAPLACAAMRGCGLGREAAAGHWFIVQPVHVQLARTHFLLADPRRLQLDEADSLALHALARPYFEELGLTLLHGGAGLWFVRADRWAGLETASPDAAAMQNLGDWMPEGEGARDYPRLQNEIQMLWHEHPVNAARQQRGLAAVNGFWLWGGADGAAGTATPERRDHPLFVRDGPAWMAALAAPERREAGIDQLLAGGGTAVLAGLIAPALASDWAEWLARMQRLEHEWLAPLLAAIDDGRVARATLLLSHRSATLRVGTGKLAQRKFWRKPSLNLLLKPA